MRLCFLGKYPPIEGGVSVNNYWLAYGLAERGHQIHVVTNANEVEDDYRMFLDEGDQPWYEPTFEPSGGFVKVLEGERFSPRRMEHIPRSNPFVSKLASIATQAIRNDDCEAIFAHYYEPYAVSGYLASQWTSRPLIVKHAGSDLDRLMRVESLATTYQEILKAADAVVTRGGLLHRFLGMGVSGSRIFPDTGLWPPRSVFSPEAPPLDVEGVLRAALPNTDPKPFDPGKPTIGIYGKVGPTKGSFDLVSALGVLKREGLDFNFLAMSRGRNLRSFEQAIAANGIEDCTWLLPFLPHWKVPSFIRACTAVCFLERDFPIKIHGPGVAREVLTCGTCLILSGEIAAKQFFRDRIVDRENLLLVGDPKNHSELAAALRWVVENPREARILGERGDSMTAEFGDFREYIDGFEALFLRVLGRESTARSFQETRAERVRASPEGSNLPWRSGPALTQLLPWVKLLPQERIEEIEARLQEELRELGDGDSHAQALALCDWIEERLTVDGARDQYPYLGSLLQFQRARLRIGREGGANGDGSTPFAVDELAGRSFSPDEVCRLKPKRAGRSHIEVLDYDVTPLFGANGRSSRTPGEPEEAIAPIEKKEVILYIQRDPNSLLTELRINRLAKDLLDLCDGRHRTEEILATMAQKYDSVSGQEPGDFQTKMFVALRHLYDAQILVFAK